MSYPPPNDPQNAYQGQAPGNAYQGQAPGGYPAQGYPAPVYPPPSPARPKGSPTLGIIAAVAAIAGVVIGSILVGVAGAQLGDFVAGTTEPGFDPSSIDEEEILPFFFGMFAGFLVYGVLGLWGLIQGIIATVLNRGRGWGIAAIIVSVLGCIPVIIVWSVTFVSAIPMTAY